MKISIINKSFYKGGAAIAFKRLHSALKNNIPELQLQLLIGEGNSKENIISIGNKFKKHFCFFIEVVERLKFVRIEQSKKIRFQYSNASIGALLNPEKNLKAADIVHFHWINRGFISMKQLQKIFKLNKPVIWTLHDMWVFTGGCHYVGDCNKYLSGCENCPLIKGEKRKDNAYFNFLKKQELIQKNIEKITIVTCSKWLKTVAEKSKILQNCKIVNIPNPIDTELFCPGNKISNRKSLNLPIDKKIILFGAMNINDERKGFQYLKEALQILSSKKEISNTAICIFGKNSDKIELDIPIETFTFPEIKNEKTLISLYQSSDAYIIPSIEDNLPNTVVEAHSCGLPVVAFDNCGLTEMITHKEDGYLASPKNSNEIADGIKHILFEADLSKLQMNCRETALKNYSEKTVATIYYDLYKNSLKDE